MPSITFRGAHIRYADLRHKDEAGKFVRLHLTADWSTTVRDRMGWSDVPATIQSGKLDGELTAHNLILTPAAKELKRHELQIECSQVGDFQVVRVKDDQDGATHTELRFIARSSQADAAALVESYLATVGQAAAQLRVTHDKQEGLDFAGDGAAADDQQPTLEETEPAAGETEAAEPETKEPALASVTQIKSTMEERRKARQQRRNGAPAADARPSGVTDDDWNREQQEDPNVPHLVPEAVQ